MTPAAERTAAKKHVNKTLYLDVVSARALEFLKTQIPQAGLRLSSVALFREMLARLKVTPEAVVGVERHAERGQERGRFISISLSPPDMAVLHELEDYYRLHAKTRHRVRDGVPKSRELPLSRLFADFIRTQAGERGWQPD